VKLAGAFLLLAVLAAPARAQEGMFLTDEQAPTAVFPDAAMCRGLRRSRP